MTRQHTVILSEDSEEAFGALLSDRVREKALPVQVPLERPEQGLAKLVLALVELLHRLLEREAIRQVERGVLTDAQVERLGLAFALMEEKLSELLEVFGLTEEDLHLDLGPLGKLL